MSRLLDLPPELRNHIYQFSTLHGRHIDLSYEVTPALCRASHQIREETLPIWRANTHFIIHQDKYQYDNDSRLDFSNLPKAGSRHIQSLEFTKDWIVRSRPCHGLWPASIELGVRIQVTGKSYTTEYVEHKASHLMRRMKKSLSEREKEFKEKASAMVKVMEKILGRELVEERLRMWSEYIGEECDGFFVTCLTHVGLRLGRYSLEIQLQFYIP